MDRVRRRRSLRGRLVTFAVLWGVFGVLGLVVWVPAILLLDHFVNPRPDRPRVPVVHAPAVPVWTVLGWVFLLGAVGLMAAITYSLTFAVADLWRRELFGRSATGTALTVHRKREESQEEVAIDEVSIEFRDEAGEQRSVTVEVIGPRKPIGPGDPIRLRYPRGRP